eukprot:scaffold53595_cov47-Attheya_sp.AAC.1
MRFHANSIASLLVSVLLWNALSTVQAFSIAPPLAHRSSVSFVRTVVVPSSRTTPRLFGADDAEDEEEEETLNDCIAALEREKTMESIYVNGSSSLRTHFIRLDSRIDFRHRGESHTTPKSVVLVKNDALGDKVAIFHSGSGTGKSVELAGSSFVRSTDFTLLVQLQDSLDFENIDKGDSYISERNAKACDQLKKTSRHIFKTPKF